MKNSEIRELSQADILERLEAERELLDKSKVNHAISPLENTNVIREYKKNIARLLTELRARELAEKQK